MHSAAAAAVVYLKVYPIPYTTTPSWCSPVIHVIIWRVLAPPHILQAAAAAAPARRTVKGRSKGAGVWPDELAKLAAMLLLLPVAAVHVQGS
jgi:hypothetical protein